MDKTVVTIVGAGLIGLIYWFFFGKRGETMNASSTWNITVEGGYKPGIIKIFKDKPATLTFTRKDPNTCLEEIVLPDYKIKKFLPMNTPVTITLPPPHPGKSGIHCGMNMFHGRIEVV